MAVETLSSNVVNYLVWRYLQEAGFGKSAAHLQREWVHEPEALPFANRVHKNTLIELLQDGMYFDQLQAEAEGTRPSFSFGVEHGSKYSIYRSEGPNLTACDDTEEPLEPNGVALDSGTRKAPRRKKKSSGPERLNGDTTEIEPNGIHAPSRGESEAVMSDVESPIVEEVSTTTLSLGHSLDVQTEKIAELAPSTKVININKEWSSIKHVAWGQPEHSDKDILFAAGESLLRFYTIPTSQTLDFASATSTPMDAIHIPFDQFDVLAASWEGPDPVITIDEKTSNEEGDSKSFYKLGMIMNGNYRTISSVIDLGFKIRWSPSRQLLMVLAGTDMAGSIHIWDRNLSDPISYVTERSVLDCQWISETEFVACGVEFLKVLELDTPNREIKVTKEFDTSQQWDTVCYDPVCRFFACKSMEGDQLALSQLEDIAIQTLNSPGSTITNISFQPIPNPASNPEGSPRLLAASFESGTIQTWNVKEGFSEYYRVELEERPAYALAFSPDGYLLAAAGLDTVTIWQAERGGTPKAQWHGSAEQKWVIPGGEEDTQVAPHQLAWDADGKRLAFSLGDQLAIMNFQR